MSAATFTFELEVAVDGFIQPYEPATFDCPADGGYVEDLNIEDIGAIAYKLVDGKSVWTTRTLLAGVDLKSPDIQRLFANILSMYETDAQEALLSAADEGPAHRKAIWARAS